MNVLSLFDGISCGQLALQANGIPYENYFASEIDSAAMHVTQARFPYTTFIGDVRGVKSSNLPKIDLLIGGSPCTGFSALGKKLNFEDPQSSLFFEYVRLLNETQPKYFLLENVKMKKEWSNIISNHLGVRPVEINSNLVSAQNRKRLYWTNIPFSLPADRKILLSDILEPFNEKFELSEKELIKLDISKFAEGHNNCAFTERRTEEAKQIRREHKRLTGKDFCPRRAKEVIPRTDGKANCLTTSLTREHIILQDGRFRYLTPVEFERLQGIRDGYTNLYLDKPSIRYRMVGNAWTIHVIRQIFSQLLYDEDFLNGI